jgi:hypothetical protein
MDVMNGCPLFMRDSIPTGQGALPVHRIVIVFKR